MLNSLRLGLFRDRPVFDDSRAAYDSLVVPAHIAAYAQDGLWGFLKGISSPKFYYDPMTYLFWLDPVYWTKGSEEKRGIATSLPVAAEDIRPAFARLAEAYQLGTAVTTLSWDALRHALLADLPAATLEFQTHGTEAKSAKAVSKYAKILERPITQEAFSPTRLVAPYLPITEWSEDIRAQAELNRRTRALANHAKELWGVLAFAGRHVPSLSADELGSLGISGFDGVGLWVGGFVEHTASANDLLRYRELVRSMEVPVWLMYSGYFGVLLERDGAAEISHGVFYTENKRILGPVGSGPPAERYYIEALHRFYEPVRAFRILESIPEFECGCAECPSIQELRSLARQATPGSPDRGAWVARLQRHFLACRKREIQHAADSTLDILVAELKSSADLVEGLSASIRGALGVSSMHLRNWTSALL